MRKNEVTLMERMPCEPSEMNSKPQEQQFTYRDGDLQRLDVHVYGRGFPIKELSTSGSHSPEH